MRLAPVFFAIAILCGGCRSSEESYSDSPSETYSTPIKSRVCSEEHARYLGRLYFLANPVNEQTDFQTLSTYVLTNRDLLSNGSELITCASTVGRRLVSQSVFSFSQTDADRAYERSRDMGATMEEARKVSDSINQGAIDNLIMGEELLWLSRVIPDAAAGNWSSYQNTATSQRQQFRQVWPMYKQIVSMEPSMKSTLEETLRTFQPWIEYQSASVIYILGE